MTDFHYFISYAFTGPQGIAVGNADLTRNRPISSMGDVNDVTDLLRREGLTNPCLMSFTLFDTDVAQDTPPNPRLSGPVDGLAFDYIRQLLQEHGRPLTADTIADLLGFPADAVRRVAERAVGRGRLVVTVGGYTLPSEGDHR